MGIKRKHIITCMTVVLSAVLAVFIFRSLYRQMQDIKLDCMGTRGKVYRYADEYYYIQSDGIYVYPDKKLASLGGCRSIAAENIALRVAADTSLFLTTI